MARKSILVVDDEKNQREILETILSGEGYDVTTASSGEAAMKFIMATRNVVALTLLLGLVLLCLNRLTNAQRQPNKVPTVSLCQLDLFPMKYDGKIIRIKGTYVGTFEGKSISDPSCNNTNGMAVVKYSCDSNLSCSNFAKQLDGFTTGNPLDGEFAGIIAVGRVEYYGNRQGANQANIEFHVLKIEQVSAVEKK